MRQKTRIDKLVGDHALALSERLQAHRAQLFPPNAKRQLRKFTSGEVAELLGVKDAYLRKLDLEGKGPSPETRAVGEKMIQRELENIPKEKVRQVTRDYLAKIEQGARDFRF